MVPGLISIDGVATSLTLTVISLLVNPPQLVPPRLAKANLLMTVVSGKAIEPAGKSALVCPTISSQVAAVLDCH